jgi:ABC-2 type transport system ATP-binding protein
MKQKVSLASALAGDVSVAFLDEPTLGLDVESSLKLRGELRRLAEERGLTLLISSHDMDVIEDVCDRVIIMREGRVVANDTVADLLADFETRGYRITVREMGATALSDLRERFDLRDVERTDGRTRFEVAADSETFYRLADAMERHGLELAAVDTLQPDLAEAFVEMTTDSATPRTADSAEGGERR